MRCRGSVVQRTVGTEQIILGGKDTELGHVGGRCCNTAIKVRYSPTRYGTPSIPSASFLSSSSSDVVVIWFGVFAKPMSGSIGMAPPFCNVQCTAAWGGRLLLVLQPTAVHRHLCRDRGQKCIRHAENGCIFLSFLQKMPCF